MSYTPTQWENGDIVTAEKLNHMESGIQNSGALVLHINYVVIGQETVTVDKTAGEIFEAAYSGREICAYRTQINPEDETQKYVEYWTLTHAMKMDGYFFELLDSGNVSYMLTAQNASDYPSWISQEG